MLVTFWNLRDLLINFTFQSFRRLRLLLLLVSTQSQLIHLNVFYLGSITDGLVLVLSLILRNISIPGYGSTFSPPILFYIGFRPGSAVYEKSFLLPLCEWKMDPSSATVFWRIWLQTNQNQVFMTSQINYGI